MGTPRVLFLAFVLAFAMFAIHWPARAADVQPADAQKTSTAECPAPATYSPRDRMFLNISCAAIAVRNSYEPKTPPHKGFWAALSGFWAALSGFFAGAWQAIVAIATAGGTVGSWLAANEKSGESKLFFQGLGVALLIATAIMGLWFLTIIVTDIATALGWIMFAIPVYWAAAQYAEKTHNENILLKEQIREWKYRNESRERDASRAAAVAGDSVVPTADATGETSDLNFHRR